MDAIVFTLAIVGALVVVRAVASFFEPRRTSLPADHVLLICWPSRGGGVEPFGTITAAINAMRVALENGESDFTVTVRSKRAPEPPDELEHERAQ